MKKGFTLIELLAVIVILAIIALITTPIILNIINDSKKEARERSIDNIIHTASIYAAKEGLDENQAVHIKNIKSIIDGEKPENGIIYFNKNGDVAFSLDFEEEVYVKSFEGNIEKEEKAKTDDQIYTLKVETTTSSSSAPFLYGPIKKEQVQKVIMLPSNKVPNDAKGSWDVTNIENSGKVMAWYKDEDGNDLYEVYIGQNGGVKANEDSSKLFNYVINVSEIDLTYFNTEYVTNMFCMFQEARSLKKIDVSNFDTSKVTNMVKLFGVSTDNYMDLEEIVGLENFDTSEVTNMRGMFTNCNKLVELNVSSFDTSKVTNMSFMFGSTYFNNDSILQPMRFERIIGIENFDTSSVGTVPETRNDKGFMGMFQYCNNLRELDLSKWKVNVSDFPMDYMFAETNNLTVYVTQANWKTPITNEVVKGNNLTIVDVVLN